jgi:L-threonylcarbamoyladenylate synthase
MNFEEEIKKSIEVLRKGGTILYPTDTIWGIGCDATNVEAVKKIFEIKKREESKSLIVLVCNEQMLQKYVRDIPEVAWELIEASDKPLTIIYDKTHGIASNVLAQDGSLAVRICKEEFCNKLIYKFGKPIISTSANISGEKNPTNFYEIENEIVEGVDYAVNYRREEYGLSIPSTIIKLSNSGEIRIIRK